MDLPSSTRIFTSRYLLQIDEADISSLASQFANVSNALPHQVVVDLLSLFGFDVSQILTHHIVNQLRIFCHSYETAFLLLYDLTGVD
jgi:hypothetical protein